MVININNTYYTKTQRKISEKVKQNGPITTFFFFKEEESTYNHIKSFPFY